MPSRYLELEAKRLTRLVTEWLDFESTRVDFAVVETEAKHTVELAGLTFDLRLDRTDRLDDDSLLVIDYKTGPVATKSWDLPRPDDVQLPLYAGFALKEDDLLGGLVFAKIRSNDPSFAGYIGDPQATLLPGLSNASALVKSKFEVEMLIDWKQRIEQLALDFLNGRAEVDPRDYPKTCEHCGLETLCRVTENQALLAIDQESDEDAEVFDE
jgi:ATP-dependent helicase/DNAse subunit B